MITLNKLVNKLIKKEHKIYTVRDIDDIINPWNKDIILSQTYKFISKLRKNKTLIPIKNWLFYMQKDTETSILLSDIITENYWNIVHKIIASHSKAWTFIWWKKSLELWINDLYEPDKLIIYTRNSPKKIKFNEYEVLFKKKNITSKRWFLNIINKNIINKKINNLDFNIANRELSILEYLLISDSKNTLDYNVIKKFLKKYHKDLDRNILWELVQYKYISSINRLREISKQLWYKELYKDTLDIINMEWKWCFLSMKI